MADEDDFDNEDYDDNAACVDGRYIWAGAAAIIAIIFISTGIGSMYGDPAGVITAGVLFGMVAIVVGLLTYFEPKK